MERDHLLNDALPTTAELVELGECCVIVMLGLELKLEA